MVKQDLEQKHMPSVLVQGPWLGRACRAVGEAAVSVGAALLAQEFAQVPVPSQISPGSPAIFARTLYTFRGAVCRDAQLCKRQLWTGCGGRGEGRDTPSPGLKSCLCH